MKKIALIVNSSKEEGKKYALQAIDILTSLGCSVFLSKDTDTLLCQNENVYYVDNEILYSEPECVIVFGGDGTIMRNAHKTSLPILSVNLGRIGYIAELETNELFMLKDLAEGNYSVEDRMMLSFSVQKQDKTVYEANALNEIVLSKGSYSVMPEIELVCNDEEVGKYFADGLICSTPTGSTAYSLSAGGSIVDPGMECFCVSQICPQSFYAKPLIFNGNSILKFKKGKRGHGKILLVSDGEYVTEIEENDVVTVNKSKDVTKLIKIKKNNFYSVMRSKMTEI